MAQKTAQTLYRHVLRDAWSLAWNRRNLWIYAFFAAFITTGGLIDYLFRAINDITNREIARLYPGTFPTITEIVAAITPRGALTLPPWFLFMIVIGIILLAVFVWFSIISQGALITGVAATKVGGDGKKAVARGIASFWPLFGVNLIGRIAIAALIFVTAAPFGLAMQRGDAGASLLYFISFIAFVILFLAISIITLYAIIDVALVSSSMWRAIVNASKTFKKHWLISLEAAVVVLGVEIVAAVGYIIGIVFLFVPFVLVFLMMQLVGTITGIYFFLSILGIAGLVWTIAVVSFLTTFRYSVWTLLYERLQSRKAVSKIVRILKAIPEVFRMSRS